MTGPPVYPITTVCRRTGLSSCTLRHWERRGLLTPASVGPGGVRRYSEDNLGVMVHLVLLRTLGLLLPHRSNWTEGPPSAEVLQNARTTIEDRARLTPDLLGKLHRADEALDCQDVLSLLQLLVRWRQP